MYYVLLRALRVTRFWPWKFYLIFTKPAKQVCSFEQLGRGLLNPFINGQSGTPVPTFYFLKYLLRSPSNAFPLAFPSGGRGKIPLVREMSQSDKRIAPCQGTLRWWMRCMPRRGQPYHVVKSTRLAQRQTPLDFVDIFTCGIFSILHLQKLRNSIKIPWFMPHWARTDVHWKLNERLFS